MARTDLTRTLQQRMERDTDRLAQEIYDDYNKEKEKVIQKYAVEFENLVKQYASNIEFTYDGTMRENEFGMAKGWQVPRRYSKNGGHYESGVVSEVNKEQTEITVINLAKPTKPIFSTEGTKNLDSKTRLTEWIVNGDIHPLPPHGTWWINDDWEKTYYKPQPYFDWVLESPEYEQLQKEFHEALEKTLSESYHKVMSEYLNKLLGGR
jgi:hypothetical protein